MEHEIDDKGGIYDIPGKRFIFKCNCCLKELKLDFQGRTRQKVEDRAKERDWTVLDPVTVFCPEHKPAESTCPTA
jgi:hypothetical protein